jgi:hypothetical protein
MANALLTKDLYDLYFLKDALELRYEKTKYAPKAFAVLTSVLLGACLITTQLHFNNKDVKGGIVMTLGFFGTTLGVAALASSVERMYIKHALDLINKQIARIKGDYRV